MTYKCSTLYSIQYMASPLYVYACRYNHRVQIFDPNGNFLRSFGCQGTGDGKFSYPWGITTDPLGFIYVCDKENHRVQVPINIRILVNMKIMKLARSNRCFNLMAHLSESLVPLEPSLVNWNTPITWQLVQLTGTRTCQASPNFCQPLFCNLKITFHFFPPSYLYFPLSE